MDRAGFEKQEEEAGRRGKEMHSAGKFKPSSQDTYFSHRSFYFLLITIKSNSFPIIAKIQQDRLTHV